MLNSLVWTDRNNAAVALVTMTESRDPGMLDQLRSRAMHSVVEMARWKYLPHSLPGFILAGRLARFKRSRVAGCVEQGAARTGDQESTRVCQREVTPISAPAA